MQVSKWGNSLAVRLPATVVEALKLKEGDDIEIHVVQARTFEVSKKPGARELLARIRKFRGRLPADFRFDRLNAILGERFVVNYGKESPNGEVDDLSTMRRARATVHVKDGQVACNAVVRSMAVGTPVLMDRKTWHDCFFDGIQGIRVRDSVEELASDISRLAFDDEWLQDSCDEAWASAHRQFSYDSELGARFLEFLGGLMT